MKFSIVIPLYNKAPYIATAVQSVLAQTFTDFEVIVVDDGSNDGGAELVAKMTDPRLRLVRQANAGVSAARNYGISLARGEWIAFLDADDWHHPSYLATLLHVQQTHPEVDTVASDFVRLPHALGKWPSHWSVVESVPEVEIIADLPKRWMSSPTLSASSVIVRATQLQKMQPCFPLGESRGEDLDLWFRLAEHSPIALAHTPLVAYRQEVQDSLSSKHGAPEEENFMVRLRKRALSGALTPTQSKSSLWLIAQFEVSIARQEIASGSRIEGLRSLIKGRHAARSKRWLLTAAMALFLPRYFVNHWESWRNSRQDSAEVDAPTVKL